VASRNVRLLVVQPRLSESEHPLLFTALASALLLAGLLGMYFGQVRLCTSVSAFAVPDATRSCLGASYVVVSPYDQPAGAQSSATFEVRPGADLTEPLNLTLDDLHLPVNFSTADGILGAISQQPSTHEGCWQLLFFPFTSIEVAGEASPVVVLSLQLITKDAIALDKYPLLSITAVTLECGPYNQSQGVYSPALPVMAADAITCVNGALDAICRHAVQRATRRAMHVRRVPRRCHASRRAARLRRGILCNGGDCRGRRARRRQLKTCVQAGWLHTLTPVAGTWGLPYS